MTQPIRISDHFGYRRLLRFTLPTMAMMVFTSIYGIVDGIFVSNFAGKTPFAAVNLIMPFLMVLGVLGFMLGTGGSALVAKTLGEGDHDKANRIFSMLVLAGFLSGILFSLLGILFLPRVTLFLGAKGEMVSLCVTYGRIILVALPFFILQNMFQALLVTAEKPRLGLQITIVAGCLNILLDFLMIGVWHMGVSGAALATAISQTVGGLIPAIYFLLPNRSLLRITTPSTDFRAYLQSCYNGMSEFFGNVSASIVSMCYNYQLMRFIGEDGVSAYGVIMYVQFIFFSIFMGFTVGSAPIVSYHYGAGNHAELHNLFTRSLRMIGGMGLLIVLTMELLSRPLTQLFVGYDEQLFLLTCRAFRIYCLSYFLVGFNFYASSFFTALNNGALSAVISTVRTMVFEIAAVFVLPILLGPENIWFSIVFAEAMSLLLSSALLITNRKRYHY